MLLWCLQLLLLLMTTTMTMMMIDDDNDDDDDESADVESSTKVIRQAHNHAKPKKSERLVQLCLSNSISAGCRS